MSVQELSFIEIGVDGLPAQDLGALPKLAADACALSSWLLSARVSFLVKREPRGERAPLAVDINPAMCS
jgi:hypothetical protein